MKKHNRKHRSDGGDLSPISCGIGSRYQSLHRSHGGGISAKELSMGKAGGVRKGTSPAERLATGHCEGRQGGTGAKSIGMGHPTGRRKFATGGHATDMGFEVKGERLKKTRQRNDILGSPHYAEGGGLSIFRSKGLRAAPSIGQGTPSLKRAKGGKVDHGMRALYHALHSHFASEPQMKKLHVKESQLYEGEPHRYKRASGGHLNKFPKSGHSKLPNFKNYRPQ